MEIVNEKTLFSIMWIALMLIYLLGDVLRIFAGDYVGGEIDGEPVSQTMWMMVALMMVVPIVMVVLNILVPVPYMKWPNIIVSMAFFLLNIAGLGGYKPYDQFLLGVSFVVNFIIVYFSFVMYK